MAGGKKVGRDDPRSSRWQVSFIVNSKNTALQRFPNVDYKSMQKTSSSLSGHFQLLFKQAVMQSWMWANWVLCNILKCYPGCRDGRQEQSTSTISLMYEKWVNVIFLVWNQPVFLGFPFFRLPASEQSLAHTSQVKLFNTAHAHEACLACVHRHFTKAWFCDFAG